ncbi:MAG: dipeptide epimerase [Gammaproteobacteria bacterium]|nr:dipeptide epimerase [Gammaproteobacteria bacterium]
MTLRATATIERWPIAGEFTIARGSKTTADVVVATVVDGDAQGRGECVPYGRYGESVEQVADEIGSARIPDGRDDLVRALPAGAARNAIDCALWDLNARRQGKRVWELLDIPPPARVVTAFTLSLASPAGMAQEAERHAHLPLLKAKLGDTDGRDAERLRAVRRAAPDCRLIVDVNEGWDAEMLASVAPVAADLGVELIEQPLPAGADAILATYDSPVPLGADESVRDGTELTSLVGRYQVVNIKLDKTGGLTRAIEVVQEARRLGFEIMLGCMVATSLAMAPALMLARHARFVDLDGPLLLAKDRPGGLHYNDGVVSMPGTGLWG